MSNLINVVNGTLSLNHDTCNEIISLERTIKQLKKKQDEYKAALLQEMREQGVIKLSTNGLSISYIAATDRESFDSKKFRADYPDMYDRYVRISPVKESIRIKVTE